MDLRILVGALFTAVGVVLAVNGLVVDQSGSVQLGVNVNLVWRYSSCKEVTVCSFALVIRVLVVVLQELGQRSPQRAPKQHQF